MPELEGLGQEKAVRTGGHRDPRALSPGMKSSRCPAGTATVGHLGTSISWCPNRTEVKTRLQHAAGFWALGKTVQIKDYGGTEATYVGR